MNQQMMRWGVLLSSALAIFIVNVDISIVNVVLPSLVTTFSTSFGEISMVTLSYLISLTAFLLVSGKLSDIYGPESILALGYGIFIVSSVLCGLSRSLEALELFRFVQGIGAAMLFSTSAVIITRYITPDWQGRAFGINGLFACVGFAMGSPVGGFIQEMAGWSWIFFVNIPVGLGGLILARYLLRRPYPRNSGSRFDRIGFLLSLVMIGSLVYSLHYLSDPHTYPQLLVSIPVAILSLLLFVIYERRVAEPLLDFSVFRDKILVLALGASFFYTIILAGTSFLFPFYLIDLLGYLTSTAGLYLSIPTFFSIVLAYLSGYISDKRGPRIPCIIGMSFCIVAAIAFHGFGISTSGTYIFLSLVIFGIGIGLFVPASVALIMNQSGATNKGTISSLKSLAVQFGSITGVTFCTILYSAGVSGQKVTDTLSQNRLAENFSHAMTFILLCALLCLLTCIAAKKPLEGRDPRE